MRQSALRILAMTGRHLVVLVRSWPRLMEAVYMPTVSVFQWLMVKKYFSSLGLPLLGVSLLAGWMLWEIIFRFKQGTVMSLFEEMWSRSLAQLFSTPLRPLEILCACFLVGLIRITLGLGISFAVIAATGLFVGYGLAAQLIALAVLGVIAGAAVSLLMAGFILRFGIGAENLSWAMVFTLAPLSGVLYPTSVLPAPVQLVSALLPTKYIFDCLREFFSAGSITPQNLGLAASVVAAWAVISVTVFLMQFERARNDGLLAGAPE